MVVFNVQLLEAHRMLYTKKKHCRHFKEKNLLYIPCRVRVYTLFIDWIKILSCVTGR